ncbi:MAG: cytochrome c family protein, partial [Acidobacteria bacterium]|nr:cytochrome c family protein [Acidobacteriota bacterium]
MQVFHRNANALARLSIVGGLVVAGVLGAVAWFGYNSPLVRTRQNALSQPVPFSHQHHVAGLGIDCRYCHTSVEESSFAGMPSTQTCMNCHSQIWTSSPELSLVRASFFANEPIHWQRVNSLPDFVFFDHSAHVNNG